MKATRWVKQMVIQRERHLGMQMEIQTEKHLAIQMESCWARNLDWPRG
jgi:hypothetical protein